MTKRTIKTFLTSHGGIVKIVEIFSTTEEPKTWYDAYWSPDFMMSMRLGDGSAFSISEETTIAWAKRWDSQLEEITDFGEYQLFAREPDRSGEVVISLKNRDGCNNPIKARDVKPGSYLINHADDFFKYYKGHESVSNHVLV